MNDLQNDVHDEAPPLVVVEGLHVVLPGEGGDIDAVRRADLVIEEGERIGVVGESGSGKSITGRAIAGLLPTSPRVRLGGSIRFSGREMVSAPPSAWNEIRRKRVGMIFQDPLTYLNPTMRVGKQVAESIPAGREGNGAARTRAVHRFLEQAGLDEAEEIAAMFPHELSGGMRQRVLIAIAIAKLPELIIADEPTTALDATVQQRVLHTLDAAVSELGTSLMLISHDLAVVAGMTDRIYVMYAGRIVEQGPTEQVLHEPRHPYTRALLRSLRSLTDDGVELYSMPPELRLELDREVAGAS